MGARVLRCTGPRALPVPPVGRARALPARARGRVPRAGNPDRSEREALEDELKDSRTFVDYFLPRPIRVVLLGGSAASCLVGTGLTLLGDGGLQNAAINLAGAVAFAGLLTADLRGAVRRKEQRRRVVRAQIEFGDREVFVNEDGDRMSRLKEVDDDWILRRLDRFGRRDGMPYVGPQKGVLVQRLLRDSRARCPVEVGTMCGYSAILFARVLEELDREDDARGQRQGLRRLVTFESSLQWWLVAKRYLWQASQGAANAKGARLVPLGERVDVRLGRAQDALRGWQGPRIDFLFLDGTPKETLEYLKAAEPHLAPGAIVVADNAGVFAQGGMQAYLQYVRSSSCYESQFLESVFDFREDVPDGLEVSVYRGSGAAGAERVADVGASGQVEAGGVADGTAGVAEGAGRESVSWSG